MNQETQIMDRNNLFHAIVSYVPGRFQPTCATDRGQAQPFHLWRARRDFEQAGLQAYPSPSPNRTWPLRLKMTAREVFLVLRDLLAGR